MYIYRVVFENTRTVKGEETVIEENEYIVATSIDDVFARAKMQDQDNHELIAIIRREPVVCVLPHTEED